MTDKERTRKAKQKVLQQCMNEDTWHSEKTNDEFAQNFKKLVEQELQNIKQNERDKK